MCFIVSRPRAHSPVYTTRSRAGTAADTKVLEVRHRCSSTRANDGFGLAANLTTEVYTVAEFFKEV